MRGGQTENPLASVAAQIAVCAFERVDLGRRGGGGKRKRVAVARSIVMHGFEYAVAQFAHAAQYRPQVHRAPSQVEGRFIAPRTTINVVADNVAFARDLLQMIKFARARVNRARDADWLDLLRTIERQQRQPIAIIKYHGGNQRVLAVGNKLNVLNIVILHHKIRAALIQRCAKNHAPLVGIGRLEQQHAVADVVVFAGQHL